MYPPWFQKSVNASSGFDDKTMGMTQQRQQEIKSSIKTMLGGQETAAGEEEDTEKNSVEVELPLSVENDDDDNQ
jgi:hypothetical protein